MPSVFYVGYVPQSGYFSAPPDVYFQDSFSVTVWVNPISVTNWARVIDFGNGSPMENFLFGLSTGGNGRPLVELFNLTSYLSSTRSPQALPLSEWTHLAAVISNSTVRLFMNASLVASLPSATVNPVMRYRNYIGKSNWGGDSLADCKYRNLRFYRYDLSLSQIVNDMTAN